MRVVWRMLQLKPDSVGDSNLDWVLDYLVRQ